MEKKQSNKTFLILMIVLTVVLLAGIGVILAFLLPGCNQKEEDSVSASVQLSDEQGVPDSVVRGFFKSFCQNDLKGYTDYTYDVDHDVTLETHGQKRYIRDVAQIHMLAKDEYYTYRYQYDVIFLREVSSDEWGVTTFSFTRPEKVDEKPAPASPEAGVQTPVPSDTETESPTEVPDTPSAQPVTPPPTDPATEPPTPPSTALPDSFTFGGAVIARGTTEISGKALKINGKEKDYNHISADELNMLVLLCPDLKVLDLDYCWFDTYEPLSKLTKLEHLELKTCAGNPITSIEWIRPLVNMKKLNLCHNKISDLDPLENLTKLEYLQLGDNRISDEELETIAKLTELTELYLYKNYITDVTPLQNLNKVVILNLGSNKNIKTVEPLTKMKKLQDLRIYSTNISDLSYFPQFKTLKIVNLANCPLKFKQYYDYLPKCPKLKKFRVSRKDPYGSLAGDAILNDGYDLDYEFTD